MFSRAHLLIELEYENLLKDSPWGIEATPIYDDTIFEWIAKIKGLKNTPWEGGIFKVYIKFDEHFNVRPPQVFFQTIPFHPNVDVATGRTCVDFLDDYTKWRDDYSLSMILLSVQTLLSNPVVENAVNSDAAQMLLTSPQLYHQIILECVASSQRVEAGYSPHITNSDLIKYGSQACINQSQTCTSTSSKTKLPRVTMVSFEDYHNTWCSIATSKTHFGSANPLLESVKGKDILQEIHFGLTKEETEQLSKRRKQDHKTLFYGCCKVQQTEQTEKAAKLAQLDRMKKIYLPPRHCTVSPEEDIHAGKVGAIVAGVPWQEDKYDGWENEVDDLVLWSHTLDANAVETN